MLWPRLGAELAMLRGRRLLGMNIELQQAEDIKVDILYPDEMRKGRPGIALPGQLDKIISAAFKVHLPTEIASFHGAARMISGTRRYEVRNALIHRSAIYHAGRHKIFNVGKTLYNTNRDIAELPEAVIRSSFVGCHFFGHWLRDDCATTRITSESGTELFMPSPQWPDKKCYSDIFGLEQREFHSALVGRLSFFTDIGQNAHKAARLRELREQMSRAINPIHDNHIVYIKRGKGATQRALVNEARLIEALEKRGVIIVESEAHELPDMLAQLRNARMVISVEGSQISHSIYTIQDEGAVLTIQPPTRFFNSHLDWCEPLGMHYGVVVGDPAEGGFTVNIDDLLRTIDLFKS